MVRVAAGEWRVVRKSDTVEEAAVERARMQAEDARDAASAVLRVGRCDDEGFDVHGFYNVPSWWKESGDDQGNVWWESSLDAADAALM